MSTPPTSRTSSICRYRLTMLWTSTTSGCARVDPDIGQQWHQALPESFPLFPRVPYLADSGDFRPRRGAVG